jgi:hypothetical protein
MEIEAERSAFRIRPLRWSSILVVVPCVDSHQKWSAGSDESPRNSSVSRILKPNRAPP